jgi:hypothetical protein
MTCSGRNRNRPARGAAGGCGRRFGSIASPLGDARQGDAGVDQHSVPAETSSSIAVVTIRRRAPAMSTSRCTLPGCGGCARIASTRIARRCRSHSMMSAAASVSHSAGSHQGLRPAGAVRPRLARLRRRAGTGCRCRSPLLSGSCPLHGEVEARHRSVIGRLFHLGSSPSLLYPSTGSIPFPSAIRPPCGGQRSDYGSTATVDRGHGSLRARMRPCGKEMLAAAR